MCNSTSTFLRKGLLLLTLLLGSTGMFAQLKVSGTVKNESGEPMVGVTIVVENSIIGATTDINGYYTL